MTRRHALDEVTFFEIGLLLQGWPNSGFLVEVNLRFGRLLVHEQVIALANRSDISNTCYERRTIIAFYSPTGGELCVPQIYKVAPPVSRTTPSRKPNSTEQNGRNVSESRIYHPVLSAIPKDAFALAEERTTC